MFNLSDWLIQKRQNKLAVELARLHIMNRKWMR